MELYFLALLIVLMALALASGYPVAFALPGSAILTIVIAGGAGWLFADNFDAYFHQGGPSQWLSAGATNLRGVYWEIERDTLIAIPLFIFMGIMLQRSKIAEDLLLTMAQLFGPVRGGLGISVIFVGALLAATTGILGATVVAMGLISLPAMLRNNYSQPLATGTIAASGTLGQIIPPSIVLIILADQLSSAVDQASTQRQNLYKAATGQLSMPSEYGVVSTSAGEMFLGALVPGILLVLLYMLYVLVLAWVNPKAAPAVPRDGPLDWRFARRILVTLVPPLALIFLVLGSILAGIATVNQAGAIGAAGAMLMASYRLYEGRRGAFYPAILGIVSMIALVVVLEQYDTNIKRIDSADDQMGVNLAIACVSGVVISLAWACWRSFRIDDTLRGVMVDTAKTTSLVFIILLGAAMLTAAFRAFGGEDIVRDYLQGLPGGFWSQFIIVMAVIFFLGFFLDFIEIAVVVVPIVAPILLADPAANITAVWLGVMIGLNIQTSFLTPPFGFALFYLRGVAPAAVKTIQMYKGVVPFIALQLIALAIVGYTPELVNYLPNRVFLTSQTAPPPRNPKLQYCLEKYVGSQFATRSSEISAAISSAQHLDLSYLPKRLAKTTAKSFKLAGETRPLLVSGFDAEKQVAAGADAFRPLHIQVRLLEKNMRRANVSLEEAKTILRRLEDDSNARPGIELKIAALTTAIADWKAQIPAQWDEQNKAFRVKTKAEQVARRQYRRTADQSYAGVVDLLSVLESSDLLVTLGPSIRGFGAKFDTLEAPVLVEQIKALEKQLREVKGNSSIRKGMSKARRALRGRRADPEKAKIHFAKAVKAYDEQLVWRKRAQSQLLPALSEYESAIRGTIGARQQTNMTREQALFISACNAGHRNISLNF